MTPSFPSRDVCFSLGTNHPGDQVAGPREAWGRGLIGVLSSGGEVSSNESARESPFLVSRYVPCRLLGLLRAVTIRLCSVFPQMCSVRVRLRRLPVAVIAERPAGSAEKRRRLRAPPFTELDSDDIPLEDWQGGF